MFCVLCHIILTQTLFCLHVFRQAAGPAQRVDCFVKTLNAVPTLGPSSLPVVVAQPDERHANRTVSVFIHDIDKEEASLMVLFFGLVLFFVVSHP